MPSNQPPATINDIAKKNMADLVKKAATAVLTQSLDYSRDFPEFIRSESPASGPFDLARGIARQSCRRWARGEGIPSLPGFDALYGGICKPYLEDIGELPQDGGVFTPFDGGQCPGAQYEVFARGLPAFGGEITQSSGFVLGPVEGILRTPTGSGDAEFIGLRFNGTDAPTQFGVTTSAANSGTWRIINIVRVDGGSDNCGDPPAQYDPPNIPPGLPPLTPRTINIPGIGPIDVDVTFNPDGSINVSLPDFGIDVTLPNPLLDDGEGGEAPGGDDGPSDGPPGDIGESADPDDSGEGGEAAGCAPEGSVLVGVRINILESPPGARQFAPGVFRGACYAYLGVPGNLDHDPAGAMLRDGQFIFSEKDNLTCYLVRANPGYNLRVTPYYREILE